MGLEAFKTEGPRTRTKSNEEDKRLVHVMEGSDSDKLDIPSHINTHKVIRAHRRSLVVTVEGHDEIDNKIFVVCTECGRISPSFNTMLKIDKFDFKLNNELDKWDKEFINRVKEEEERIDREDTMIGNFNIGVDNTDKDEPDSSSDDEEEGGLMAFKT